MIKSICDCYYRWQGNLSSKLYNPEDWPLSTTCIVICSNIQPLTCVWSTTREFTYKKCSICMSYISYFTYGNLILQLFMILFSVATEWACQQCPSIVNICFGVPSQLFFLLLYSLLYSYFLLNILWLLLRPLEVHG